MTPRLLMVGTIVLATATVVVVSVVLGLQEPGGVASAAGRSPAVAAMASTSRCAEHVQVRLFFGLSTPTRPVSDLEWARFLADVITPRFPRGLTVVRADGQWRAPGRADVTREPSQVVEIVDDGGADMDQRIGEIVAIYRQRFHQDSVMRTRGRVEVCF
jgi:hypothetical protein